MKAITVAMVLVGVATAGISIYVSVSGAYLGNNLMTQFQLLMGEGGTNSTGFGVSATNTSVRAWLPFTINNTGPVGLDITNLGVDVTFTLENGTMLSSSSSIVSIPFGTSRLVNVTLIDTTPLMAAALNGTSLVLDLAISMNISLPSSWGLFALVISEIVFDVTIPMEEGFPLS